MIYYQPVMITRSLRCLSPLLWFAIVLVACLGLPANAQAQTFQCSNVSGVPPIVRAEGFAEPIGNLILDCTGGIPTPPNQTVPPVNIAVNLDVNQTSKVTAVVNNAVE